MSMDVKEYDVERRVADVSLLSLTHTHSLKRQRPERGREMTHHHMTSTETPPSDASVFRALRLHCVTQHIVS